MSLTRVYLNTLVSHIKYLDWQFVLEALGDGYYLQVKFVDAKGEKWSGRKWYISRYSTDAEVVQTALKAVLTAIEHEAREQFTFRGVALFQPHCDLVGLMRAAQSSILRDEITRG